MIRTLSFFLLCFFIGLAISTLPSCASMTVTKADVVLPVSCAVDVGAVPAFADEKAALVAAPSIEARVRLMIAGRLQRDSWIETLTGALDACKLPNF